MIKHNLKDFRKWVLNAEEIIVNNNLNDENLEDFLNSKVTYCISNEHQTELIKDLMVESKYTPIDYPMVTMIKHLNARGYYTDWCCEGDIGTNSGYLAFTNNLTHRKIDKEKSIDILKIYFNISKNCNIKLDTDNHCIVFRWSPKTEEEKTHILSTLETEFLKLK